MVPLEFRALNFLIPSRRLGGIFLYVWNFCQHITIVQCLGPPCPLLFHPPDAKSVSNFAVVDKQGYYGAILS